MLQICLWFKTEKFRTVVIHDWFGPVLHVAALLFGCISLLEVPIIFMDNNLKKAWTLCSFIILTWTFFSLTKSVWTFDVMPYLTWIDFSIKNADAVH